MVCGEGTEICRTVGAMTVGATLPDYNNLFFAAIMDEDTEGIEELCLIHGSNSLIEIYHVTPRKVFWEALSTYPLHLAAMNRKLESMKSLLAMGADAEKRDKQGRTSLHLVIMSWPSLQSSTKESSNSSPFQAILMHVCEKAEACLQLLCEHGVDINAEVTGVNKETALHIAVSFSALSAVKTLIRYGANVNVMDSAGMTPLHRAAGILNKNILLYLIKHGADVNKRVIQSGNTPLHIAGHVWVTMAKPQADTLECITELLKHGADPNKCNIQDRTALQEACFMGCTELVDLLLSYGGDINKLNKDGENCLFMFLNRGVTVTSNELLSKLFGLTTPLIFQNKSGHLPSSLMLPCSSKLKEPILRLSQEPRSLKSICKAFIYLHHNRNRTEWQQLLPAVLYEFVFNEWDNLDRLLDVEMNNNDTASS